VVECTTVHSLQVTSQVPESEAIARELAPLLSNPQTLDEAWNEAVEQAGGVPTLPLLAMSIENDLQSSCSERAGSELL
jgi:hypothetical protein